MGRIRSFLKWATQSNRHNSKPRRNTLGLSPYHRRLGVETLEVRTLLSVVRLNVALISDAVAQAEEVRAAAAKNTIAIVYHADTMTTTGLVDLLASVSATHNSAPIGHLGIVAHGSPGEIDLGKYEDISLATMPSQATALARLRSLLTSNAEIDLYSCSVAAGAGGKTFVDELAAVTGVAVFASDNPVGTVPGADFIWEYHTGYAVVASDLFSLQQLEAIPRLLMSQPTVNSVNPAFPVATGSAQPFTINGSNFQSDSTVTLRDLTLGTIYADRLISSRTSAQIVINPNFGTRQDIWSVEVINPGMSSGQLNFAVTIPTQPQPSRQGVDYSSARPSASGLKAAGYSFAIRYVSPAGNAKNITSSEAQALQSAGLDIILVYESTANRMLGGNTAGVADANTAVIVATAAGAPQNFFCYFACDWDATLSDQSAINAYLDGAASVLGASRVGIYGGYWPVSRALDAGKAAKGWQTAAWSSGNQDSRVKLFQYAGEVSVAGGACDVDVAYGNDLGQWSSSPVDTTPPTISDLNVEPRSVAIGNSVTITYTASDTGSSGLRTAQLWRAPDTGYGAPGTWSQVGSTVDISAGGNGPYRGSFSDTPSQYPVSQWWYGVHINDGASPSNWNDQANSQTGGVPGVYGPIQITVTAANHNPNTPTNSLPANGDTGVALTPTLTASACPARRNFQLRNEIKKWSNCLSNSG